ncbi:MAG: glucosidase [Simkaniaceae bacterium]|nr:glucosidase [Simkaniaceae bacterium]
MKENKKDPTEEELRQLQIGSGNVSAWEKWGPYVSERSWGTVREDYSEDGNAWEYLTHDMARARAFRWGEDGIGAICDRYQVMVFSCAFWNGKDPFLKERLFGLNTAEGNHGEDVKECYYHLDNTPTHSYMKYLYKYPQDSFPYDKLHVENKKRSTEDREYELIDTGIFEENRYFDIQIEYAKAYRDDICVRIEVFNRGKNASSIHLIPQLIFRNTWSWTDTRLKEPVIKKGVSGEDWQCIEADDSNMEPIPRLNFEYRLNKRYLYASQEAEVLFTNNETNEKLLYGNENPTPFVKDAFHRYIVGGEECINPKEEGTKACFYFKNIEVEGESSKVFHLRLTDTPSPHPLVDVDRVVKRRKEEADKYFESIHPVNATEEERLVQRQAIAGMLWNKQIYLYDVNQWLKGDSQEKPPPITRETIRNQHWRHLISKRILSMPDKWEYPWFAAWDLSFQSIVFGLIDFKFAKEQCWYLLFDQFQHPNGQIPAYEWEFSELNPPIQAWTVLRLFNMEYEKTGKKDISFLKKCFHKLILNFVWWVNKVDSKGNNVFEGGFLGLDNITILDRSEDIPGGGTLEQSDGTGWMGMFCLTLMRMALELSKLDPDYEALATKFFEHYVYISNALTNAANRYVQLWNDQDGFFYDVLSSHDGKEEQIFVRSLVGIIPMYALDSITEEELESYKNFSENFRWFTKYRADITDRCVATVEENGKKKYVFSLLQKDQIKRVLSRIWDPEEFRSEYGLRSLSKHYKDTPYELFGNSISYDPGEATSVLKGGNSNWRGPIWFPTTFLLIESLAKLQNYYGDQLKFQNAGDQEVTPGEMATYFANSLISLFKEDAQGKRPIYADCKTLQDNPHFKDHILFYEHFHGDNGRGLGASHQTGWTGLVANLIAEWIK